MINPLVFTNLDKDYVVKVKINEIVEAVNKLNRLNTNTNELVSLCLEHGSISRGKACEYLGIDRCELDEWVKI